MKHVKKQMKLSNMNKFHIKILPLVIFFLIPFFPDNRVEVVSKNEMEQTISNLDKIIQDEMIYGNLVGLAGDPIPGSGPGSVGDRSGPCGRRWKARRVSSG